MKLLLILSTLLIPGWAYASPVSVCAISDGSQAMIVYAQDDATGAALNMAYRTLVGIPSGLTLTYCIVLNPPSVNATLTLDAARAWMVKQ